MNDNETVPVARTRRINWPFIIVSTIFHVVGLLAIFLDPSASGWLVAAAGLVVFSWIGVSMGYHRMLTHRAFTAPKWFERLLVTFAAMAIEGSPAYWVGTHTRHHKYSDQDGDPHSPWTWKAKWAWVRGLMGFLWAHFLWMCFKRPDETYRAAAAVREDRWYRFLEIGQIALQIPLGVLLWLWGGWTFVFYGIFVRTLVIWHVTWSINSLTHLWGSRRFQTEDKSRNNVLLAVLSGGEGLHNNHHHRAKSARFSVRWYDFDPIWWMIKGFARLGLVRDVIDSHKARAPDAEGAA